MPLEYIFEPNAQLLRIVGHGVVTVEDRIQFVDRMFQDAALPEKADVLIEIGEVSNAPQGADMFAIGALINRLRARFRGRVAIVNATVGHVTISNLIALSSESDFQAVRVFASTNEAREWFNDPARHVPDQVTSG